MVLEYNLQFFAKDGEGGEKTEAATPKKLDEARDEGQVAKSTDMNTAIILIILFLGLRIFGGYMYDRLYGVFKTSFGNISDYTQDGITIPRAMNLLSYGFIEIVLTVLPLVSLAVLGAFVVNVVQVKWKVTFKPLKPKFSKLNPIKGFKNFFSKDKLVALLESVLKVVILFYVVYTSLSDQWGLIVNIYQLDVIQAIILIVNEVINIAIKISFVFLVLAFADWAYRKWKFNDDMKMTKQEVKDEYKNSEGNPQIKSQIRSKMQEASRRRMMQSLPEADVVITNPTHLAVALKYDRDQAEAPIVIAKGADFLAERIKW